MHSVIVSISHRHGTIHIATNTKWMIEYSIGFTCLIITTSTNDIQRLAFDFTTISSIKREDLHSVVVFITDQQVMGEGLKTQACWFNELAKLLALLPGR